MAAGVGAAPIAKACAAETGRGGRIKVLTNLSVPGHAEIIALGDLVTLTDANGVAVPGVAQGAMQMGRHAAEVIARELHGERLAPVGRAAFC